MKLKTLFAVPILLVMLTSSVSAGKSSVPFLINSNHYVTYLETDAKQTSNPLLIGSGNNMYLEDGFPVSIWHTSGSYNNANFLDVTVTDFNNDQYLEMSMTSLSVGPLHSFDHRGQERVGFPAGAGFGAAYSAAMDNYIVSAFDGNCNPACSSYLKLHDGDGNLLWTKETLGIGNSAAPIMYKQAGMIYIVYETGSSTHIVDIQGNELQGWPRTTFGLVSFGAADLDSDGSKEILVGRSTGNGKGRLTIYRHNGSLYAETIEFGVQVRMYPTMGDVDGDGQLEIITLGRNITTPSTAQVLIFDHQGSLQVIHEKSNEGVGYGVQNSLADINNDNKPEILFIARNKIYVMDGAGNDMPGWPKAKDPYSVYNTGSNIVVGDIISDGDREYPEIVYTLPNGYEPNGAILIFNHDGTEIATNPWDNSQLFMTHYGRSNAIADIDNDGFNEVIITGQYWYGQSGYFPALWAFDLNKNQRPISHGPVEWGAYGNDSGKSGLYVKPSYN